MKRFIATLSFMLTCIMVPAQELRCKVSINHSKIQSTSNVFNTLETALNEFMNDRKWTVLQFAENERINCNINITVNKYDESEQRFSCEMLIQSSRPIYNASISTTVFNFKDTHADFNYQEFDQLEFREDMIDNNLTALLAYYAYTIIGWDLDSFSPKGGSEVLERAENIVNNAQNLGEKGWKPFEDTRNRHALITGYLDGSMEPLRDLIYKYHREGLDAMAQNADIGRTEITSSIEMLGKAHENKPLSILPQLFTEIKRDELANIYKGKGSPKEKETVNSILSQINPSLNGTWDLIKR